MMSQNATPRFCVHKSTTCYCICTHKNTTCYPPGKRKSKKSLHALKALFDPNPFPGDLLSFSPFISHLAKINPHGMGATPRSDPLNTKNQALLRKVSNFSFIF
jgi:hypothetical protein